MCSHILLYAKKSLKVSTGYVLKDFSKICSDHLIQLEPIIIN